MKFIQKTKEYATFEKPVSAPYFRRMFAVHQKVKTAKLKITGLGFYEVHINGIDITKGFLAPYRSNLNDYVYYDEYDIVEYLLEGDNVLGCIVGNGWQNPVGGYIWEFEKAPWRGPCKLAFQLRITYADGTVHDVESDSQTRVTDSPIIFNDLHYGEYYDARKELDGWDMPEYDDSKWDYAEEALAPLGEQRLCGAEPIVSSGELKPINIRKYEDGYIYDFGENNAGITRLQIRGECGQKLLLQHFETLVDGKPYFKNFRYYPEQRYQEDEYICSGKGMEIHTPRFTYHGFRYVYVTGVREEQATPELLTYVILHSDIKQIGNFVCDDEVVNKIQEATVRSDISNFHYFPTDCPQREKNGWTADASLSAEQLLLNFTPEVSFREWLRNIYKALDEHGQLPGIVPTGGWGYMVEGGPPWNGPAWDSVLVNLPYYMYIYRGDTTTLREAATPIIRYITYLYSKLNEKDLLKFGLGDWCQPNRKGEDDYETPLEVTDSMVSLDIARKAMTIFEALGMDEQKAYAEGLYQRLRKAIRKHLIDRESCLVMGETQTGQALALAYGLFRDYEKDKAVLRLVELINHKDGFMDTGVIGARVIFRVLAENGFADLAYDMITRPEYPSYGNWILRGATTLWEGFWRDDTCRILSMNHHFWGDVSAWFYIYLAGIHINPTGKDVREVCISPCFVKKLNYVNAHHQMLDGTLIVEWKRTREGIMLSVTAPKGINISFELPEGFSCICQEEKEEQIYMEWRGE